MSEQVASHPSSPQVAEPATHPAMAPVEPPPPTPERTRTSTRLNGLDVLRALASCLVFYTHIATWYRYQQEPLGVSEVVTDYVILPLHLNKDLGFFGVALFFVISGFVMAHVATKERAGEFAIKRVLRIFPALIAAVLLVWALWAAGWFAIQGNPTEITLSDVLTNMFLVNFFVPGHPPMVGVAWTLVTQLSIYAMIGLMLFVYRRAPWLAIAVQITVCSVILSILPNYKGLTASSIANIGAFGTAIVLGQVMWLVWSKRAPVWAGALLGLACWLVFQWADDLGYGRYDDSYLLTLTLASLLVVAAVLTSNRIPRLRVITYLSSRSYAVYLVHQTIAFTVLSQLWSHTTSLVAVAASIAGVLLVAELVHRAVERPFSKLAGQLTRRARG